MPGVAGIAGNLRSEREFWVSLYRFAFEVVTESIVQEGALSTVDASNASCEGENTKKTPLTIRRIRN